SKADHKGCHNDPSAIDGHEHESKIDASRELRRGRIWLPCCSEPVAEHALDDESETEGQEEPVEVIDAVEATQHRALDDDCEQAYEQRSQNEGRPVADARVVQEQVSGEGTEHVLRAMGEVD